MLGRRITTIVTHDILYGSSGYWRTEVRGVSREEEVHVVNEAAPDLCGFLVDYPSVPWSVDRDQLWNLVSHLEPTIPAVGVFVDQPLGLVAELADEVLDVVELHGSEENPYITFLRELVDVPIVQAFLVAGPDDIRKANESKADFVLLDGDWRRDEAFDWSLIEGLRRPFMLSGGLGADNVAAAVEDLRPWGVSMGSRLDVGGTKSLELVSAALAAARGAEQRS